MEKFLKIGEKYVQWIALGLGALYLILMCLFYLAQPPSDVTVELDHRTLLPAEIDPQIKIRDLAAIKGDINSKTTFVTPQPVDVVAELKTAYDQKPQAPRIALARPYFQQGGATTGPSGIPPSIVKPPAAEVAALAPSQGTSVLNVPQPAATQPAAVAGAPAAAPVQPVIAQQDHDWVTQQWTVVAKALDDAFQTAHIPDLPNVYQTAFLHVETVREELLPNGQWGRDVVVPDITTVELKPLLPETASNPDKSDFRDWAAANALNITTPPFFDVVYGTKWYPPGTPKPDDVFAPLGAPAPGAAPPGALPGAVPPAFAPRPGMLPAIPHGAPGVHSIGPAGEPAMPRGEIYRPYRPPIPREMAPPPAMAPGGFPQGMLPAGGAAGFINPALSPDITIYTHDWTVEAGHTYRYKMRYWISNPLFNVQQQIVKPADQNLLAIASPYSAWTGPIQIPSRYHFWVQKFQRNNKDEVTFDLFTRKPGAPGGLERSTVRATPGDTIGSSPWLLVDVRQDASRRNSYYFLVADPAGHIERHDLEKDAKDPDHLDMLDKSGASAAAVGLGG